MDESSGATPAASDPVIALTDLSVQFGARTVLDGFSLHVNAGETVLLKGASGCGKSTLLNILLGFVAPSGGSVRVLGHGYADPAAIWQARRQIAYVPQEPDLGDTTADAWLKQAFTYAANRHFCYDSASVQSLLNRLALSSERLSSKTSELSGGEKQRIALVGAFLLDRPLILLDEPTSALDPESRKLLYQLLMDQKGKTIVAVSHDDAATEFLPAREIWLTAPSASNGAHS